MVEVLEASVWDNDPLSNDNCLGVVEIDIAQDVAKVPGGRIYKTWYLEVRFSFICQPHPLLLSDSAVCVFALQLSCVLCSPGHPRPLLLHGCRVCAVELQQGNAAALFSIARLHVERMSCQFTLLDTATMLTWIVCAPCGCT